MALRDLIPWNNRGREMSVHRGEEANPFLTLHREMNRLFDDVFRGFDLSPTGANGFFGRSMAWPNVEVSETDTEMKVTRSCPASTRKMSRWSSRTAS